MAGILLYAVRSRKRNLRRRFFLFRLAHARISDMQVRVLFFGQLKEIIGLAQDEAELSEGARVEDLFERYGRRFPQLAEFRASIAASVNQEYAGWRAPLASGDEVAFLPPVSGGQQAAVEQDIFQLVREPIRPQEIVEGLKAPEDGALVVFDGFVRNNFKGRQTLYLEYEAYEPMAYAKMREIGAEMRAKVSHSSAGHRSPAGPAGDRRDQRADRREFAASRRGIRRLPLTPSTR